jgi:hypothetical protein
MTILEKQIMRDRKSSKRGKDDCFDTLRGGKECFVVAAVSLLSGYLIEDENLTDVLYFQLPPCALVPSKI